MIGTTHTFNAMPVTLTIPVSVTGFLPLMVSRTDVDVSRTAVNDIASILMANPKTAHPLNIVDPSLFPATDGLVGGSSLALAQTPVSNFSPTGDSIFVISVNNDTLDEGGIPPTLVETTPGGLMVVPPGGSSRGGSSSPAGMVSPVASHAGSPPISTPKKLAQPVGSSDEATALPNVIQVELEASLTSAQGTLEVLIPIDSGTQAVGLSVTGPSDDDTSDQVQVDQMSLVDPTGKTVAQIGPLWNPKTDSAPDALTVALNHAPAGGSLVVQLSASTSGTGPTATGVVTMTGGTIPFVLDVQRLEVGTTGAIATSGGTSPAVSLPARASIGTLPWTSDSDGADSAANASLPTDVAASESASILVNQVDSTLPGGEMASWDTTAPEDFSGRIALGPLASRDAAPIGPNLATVMADPAPSVDRYERALLQEIDEHDAQTGEGPAARSIQEDGPGEESPAIEESRPLEDAGPGEATTEVIAGLGALPLKVSASTGGKRVADLDALLAALPGAAVGEAGPAVASNDDLAVDPVGVSLTTPTSSSRHDRRGTPDYLTSACILAIGMGMTAGPLMPDLLRLLPSRSSRWRFAPTMSPGLSGRTGSGRRGFGPWLRRRIV
jgi:hypothetical protein